MSLQKSILLVIPFSLSLMACQREFHQTRTDTVESKLGLSDQTTGLNDGQHDKTADYLAKFPTATAAKQHIDSVRERGGKAELLKGSKTLVKAEVARTELGSLEVDASVEAAFNAPVAIQSRVPTDAADPDPSELADAVLTAKKVVGVDRLLARKPNATGQGVKVAVFDTGIDFGLLGISDGKGEERKLVGFYDTTNFGRRSVEKSSSVGLKVDPELKDIKVFGEGKLDEVELAKEYLTPTVDLDGNNKFDDSFHYIVGVNKEGKPAVWVDVDKDGVISSRALEEITDFNTSGKYILLDAKASPSGAQPLAVTIHSEEDIQFHSVSRSHGTACAIVIGAKGYAQGKLNGMAPEVKFLSYMLDVSGQDVYTVDQFLEMFLHAKEQKVDAISISWGFTVANLKSAQFLAKFLDEEIASQGIVIGIAAGNEGPAFASANAVDYMPNHGFAVGAMISEEQARNVYGWNGDFTDSVIWYSSFGPTRGGRQIPDVVSPLMTMVREHRVGSGTIFRGFGGTSSATPALIGAVAAIQSQLKADAVPVDARLLKLAVQNSATPLENVLRVRQGSGVLDVDRAYDLYLEMYKEKAAAEASAEKNVRFAYDVNVTTANGEALVLNDFRTSAVVSLALSGESLALVDPATFAEPLIVEHDSEFLQTNDVVLLQASGARFTVRFDSLKLTAAGVYQDTIRLRSQQGRVLAHIPVVVRIAEMVNPGTFQVASINETLTMETMNRRVVNLTESSALSFEGIAMNALGGVGTYLGFFIASLDGDKVYTNFVGVSGPVTHLEMETPVLARGTYEIVTFRGGSRPAVITPVAVTGAWQQTSSKVVATEKRGDQIDILLALKSSVAATKAELAIDKEVHNVDLMRNDSLPRPGYYGEVELNSPAKGGFSLVLAQDRIDERADEFLHVSLAISDLADQQTLYRGWIEFHGATSPAQEVTLAQGSSQNVGVLAYPNIVNWEEVQTQRLSLKLAAPLAEPITKEFAVDEENEEIDKIRNGSVLSFPAGDLPDHAQGTLRLLDAEGAVVAELPVSF